MLIVVETEADQIWDCYPDCQTLRSVVEFVFRIPLALLARCRWAEVRPGDRLVFDETGWIQASRRTRASIFAAVEAGVLRPEHAPPTLH